MYDNKVCDNDRPKTIRLDLPNDVGNTLKHEIGSIIKHSEFFAKYIIKNEISQLLLKYKHGNGIHEYEEQ